MINTPGQIHPLMRVPPPLLFVVAFVTGAGLQRLARLTFPAVPIFHLVGFGLVGFAVLLALSSLGTFLVARTTIVPFSAASKLVTWGPYRFTRNPMYVSLVLAYLGVAAILSQLLALILLLLPIILVRTIVIPFEEERMRELFGESYDQYCSRVRRWL
jgi:protein-S-isoprenylcysteine O-methyltransferase Ste14